MAGHAAPNIVEDGLVFLVDAANPRSWTGPNSSTVNDLIGTPTGSIFNDTSGSYGDNNSFAFDGTDDYIDTNLSTNINSFSVSCWFKGDNLQTGAQKRLFDFEDSTRTLNKFPILFVGNTTYATIGSGKIAALDYSGAVGSISADWDTNRNGLWNYVVLIVNNTNVELYLNDSSLVSGTITRDTSYQNMTKFVIGAAANTTQYYFNGEIGPIQIYNHALSAQEIKQNYNALKGRFS